jgi:phosphatidylserine/phosphatidylglycerophosphate/cardiolipin synthase-like enzyme
MKTLVLVLFVCLVAFTGTVKAQYPGEWLCDNSYQDCRTPILKAIGAEPVTGGIDVSYWFMTDWRYASALIAAHNRGVPIRIIFDTSADTYSSNKYLHDRMASAGIPMRTHISPPYINHWKMFLFAGQRKLNFSAGNFANGSYSPTAAYTGYVDEAVYFTDDAKIVNAFEHAFDSRWINTSRFRNYANINGPLVREYPMYDADPDLYFGPNQNFADRLVQEIGLENQQIDAVIFRITSPQIPNALMAAVRRGVKVRLINEPRQYRNTSYFRDSYYIDQLYKAGVSIKMKNNTTGQDMHQKSVVLYGRGMVEFGSGNWTRSSASGQEEHNIFTTQPWFKNWFVAQFERKWNNEKADGTPIGTVMYKPFVPEAPSTPTYISPAQGAVNVPQTVTLRWEGGDWAHKYDIYLDTTSQFTHPEVVNYIPGAASAGIVSTKESYTFSGLLPGRRYYWKIVNKTMADVVRSGPVRYFTTQ